MSGRDTSFYYSFLVLPRRKREAIVAVWDFCRVVDDAVDEHEPVMATAPRQPAALLDAWREELGRAYAGCARTPQGQALQPFIQEFGLPRRSFEHLIDGVAMDLTHARYASFDELREYCVRVASAVGLICLEIFGYRDPAARTYAVELGLALQLTNIVRDVAADMERGRIYLPAEDLARFGVTEEDLGRGRMTDAVRSLLRFECGRAREHYARAAAALPAQDARRLVAAEIMGAIYFALLRRIERSGYDVFSQRIRVPRPLRAAIAVRVFLLTLLPAGIRRIAGGRRRWPRPGLRPD